jgi:hypothetical protein
VKKVVLMVTALALALTPLSATAQLNPGNKPSKRGPLQYSDIYKGPDCRKGKFRSNSGQVTSNYKFCTYFYAYDPARDNNASRDFGAMWLSTRVNPTNGWCADRVKSKLGVDTRGTRSVHNRAPNTKVIRSSGAKSVRTRLVVDANGGGSLRAVLKQRWTHYPQNTRIKKFKRDGFTTLLLDWNGRTKKTVAFAGAFEMSWTGAQPPDIFPQLRALHVKPC